MSMSSSPSTNMRQARPRASAAETTSHLMSAAFAFVERIAAPFLRVSLAVILFWLGALKYFHPAPIVGLLQASFLLRFLAANDFAYLLGTLEILAAVLLLSNIAVRYVGLLVVLLFVGTLTIFVTAPAVTYGGAGFPNLSLAGQFLLKDLALVGAALTIVTHDVKRRAEHVSEKAAPPRSEMEQGR